MTELSDILPFVVVGAVLAGIGNGLRIVVGDSRDGWRGAWNLTSWAHPVIAGGLIGRFSSLPVPEGMGGSMAARVFWYLLAGVLAVPIYEVAKRAIERRAA